MNKTKEEIIDKHSLMVINRGMEEYIKTCMEEYGNQCRKEGFEEGKKPFARLAKTLINEHHTVFVELDIPQDSKKIVLHELGYSSNILY